MHAHAKRIAFAHAGIALSDADLRSYVGRSDAVMIDEIGGGYRLTSNQRSMVLDEKTRIHGRPGVTSTIIGARTMKQLEQNLVALDLPLSTDHIERIDKLSEPKLNFPAQIMKIAPNFSNAGATVNGIESTLLPQAPKDLENHY